MSICGLPTDESYLIGLSELDRNIHYKGIGTVRGSKKHNGRGKPKGHKKNKKLRGYRRT